MRIAHVFHYYCPKEGGLERAVKYLVEAQARLGLKVFVVTSDVDCKDKSCEREFNGVMVHRMSARKLLYNDLMVPTSDLEIVDVDVVHLHTQNSLFCLRVAEAYRKRSKAKIVFHMMAIDSFRTHPNPFIKLFGPYYQRWALGKALRLADLVLARSLRDADLLERRYDVKAQVLPDAISDTYLDHKDYSCSFREKYGIQDDHAVLYVGRLHKLKGPHVLVKAIGYLDDYVKAVVMGPDDGYKKDVEKLAKRLRVEDRVLLTGYVDERTKISAIDASTAVVVPSISDNVEVYPMVISEAWSRRKSVVASTVGGIPYRVKDEVNGLLVGPGDPRQLAHAIDRLVSDSGLATRLGQEGRKSVRTWGEIAESSVQIYNRLLQ